MFERLIVDSALLDSYNYFILVLRVSSIAVSRLLLRFKLIKLVLLLRSISPI
jgi:hypothetical protein